MSICDIIQDAEMAQWMRDFYNYTFEGVAILEMDAAYDRERYRNLQKAGEKYASAVDRILASDEMMSMFVFADVHGVQYKGENVSNYTERFRAVLCDKPSVFDGVSRL